MTINVICRDSTGKITEVLGNHIGDCPIVIVQTLEIQEAIGTATRMENSKLL